MSTTNLPKNNATINNLKIGGIAAWDDSVATWDDASFLWDNATAVSNTSKNNASITNISKS